MNTGLAASGPTSPHQVTESIQAPDPCPAPLVTTPRVWILWLHHLDARPLMEEMTGGSCGGVSTKTCFCPIMAQHPAQDPERVQKKMWLALCHTVFLETHKNPEEFQQEYN